MNWIGMYFLVYIGVFLPFLSFRGAKRVRLGKSVPARTQIYLSTAGFLMATFLLAWLAARDNWILLFPKPSIRLQDVGIGVAALGMKLGYFLWRLRTGGLKDRPALGLLAPQTNKEKMLFCLLVVATGIAEETAYRGTAFVLFSRLLQNAWFGALASAIAFGLAHRIQGLRAMAVIVVHALVDQLVVYLTGSLYIAIVVHIVYDLVAGFSVSAMLKRQVPI